MKNILLTLMVFGIVGCSMPQEEKEEIAIIACNIMGESRNMDGVMRIKEINAAREKIGEEAFLSKDDIIKESFIYGLCKELVLNDVLYSEKLAAAKAIEEAQRIEAAIIAEEERIEAARIAEEERIEAARIAEEERIEAARTAEEERIAEEIRLAEQARIDRMIDGMKPINSITPVYPERAKQRGIIGYVDLVFNISDTGKVFNIVSEGYCGPISEARPCSIFNDSAVDAASKFIFDPLIVNGLTVAAESKTHRFIFSAE
jgi:predicted RNA-binding protein